MIYTGIGSRETPPEILDCFIKIGKYLGKTGWILRSGGADGADSAFEYGCDLSDGRKEIYLPWAYFNGNDSTLYEISKESYKLAEKYHPYWYNLKDSAKKLQARNCYQALGYDLNEPADLIICYTKGGKLKGGTAQVLRIAKDYGIKVFNVGSYENIDEFRKDLWDYIKTLDK